MFYSIAKKIRHLTYNKVLERINLTDYLPFYFKLTLVYYCLKHLAA